MLGIMVQLFLGVVFIIRLACTSSSPSLIFPLQFAGTVIITSHLIDESSEYPPRTRQMTIYYDYINKKARADIESGYEAAKVYIRHYHTKNEYMVRLPPINDCKRSYLGEVMPFPDIEDVEFVDTVDIDGTLCNHFIHEDYDTQVHIYMASDTSAPVRLVQYGTESSTASEVDAEGEYSTNENLWIPLLTYDYTDVQLGQPDDSWFTIPDPYDHSQCTRHVGGFPYLHIFHYFVRF
jgi:hypothetical protein